MGRRAILVHTSKITRFLGGGGGGSWGEQPSLLFKCKEQRPARQKTLLLSGASPISHSLCNRHRNNNCLATGNWRLGVGRGPSDASCFPTASCPRPRKGACSGCAQPGWGWGGGHGGAEAGGRYKLAQAPAALSLYPSRNHHESRSWGAPLLS